MSDFSNAVRAAVYQALVDAAVAGGRVFDLAPDATDDDAANFPYVELGEDEIQPDDTSGEDGGIVQTMTLHVWSRQGGRKEAADVASAIHDALHSASLAVPGRSSAYSWVRSRRIIADPDGRTMHGVVTVEIIHRS